MSDSRDFWTSRRSRRALITGGFDLYFERRREQADLREAKRLVADEVHTQWLHHDMLLEAGRYPLHDVEKMMPTDAWDANKATLARHVDDQVWGFVVLVEHTMNRTRLSLIREQPGQAISPHWLGLLEDGRHLASTAYEMLTGKTSSPKPSGQSAPTRSPTGSRLP